LLCFYRFSELLEAVLGDFLLNVDAKSYDYHNVDFYQQTLTKLCFICLEVLTPRIGQLLTDYLTTGADKLAMF